MADYIDREALKNDGHLCYHDGKGTVYYEVDHAPAADVVEVRHGKWDDNIIGFCNVCMECGAIVERPAVKSHTGKLNYCPNCGAKMDGKDGADNERLP